MSEENKDAVVKKKKLHVLDSGFKKLIQEINNPKNNFNIEDFLECADNLKELDNPYIQAFVFQKIQNTAVKSSEVIAELKEDKSKLMEKSEEFRSDINKLNDTTFEKINDVIHSKGNPVIDEKTRTQCAKLITNINLATKLKNTTIFANGSITKPLKEEWLQTLEQNILILESKLSDLTLKGKLSDLTLERELSDLIRTEAAEPVYSGVNLNNLINSNSKEVNPDNNNNTTTTTATDVGSKVNVNFLVAGNDKIPSQNKGSLWENLSLKNLKNFIKMN